MCSIEFFSDLEEKLVRETEERHYGLGGGCMKWPCVGKGEDSFLLSGVTGDERVVDSGCVVFGTDDDFISIAPHSPRSERKKKGISPIRQTGRILRF